MATLLIFDPLVLNICGLSTVPWSNSVPNFSKIWQPKAELQMIQQSFPDPSFQGQYCLRAARRKLHQICGGHRTTIRTHKICFSSLDTLPPFETTVPQRWLGSWKSRPNFTLFHPITISHGLNDTKFGQNIGQSLMLSELLLDFVYIAPFWNYTASKPGKTEAKFGTFLMPEKLREIWAKCLSQYLGKSSVLPMLCSFKIKVLQMQPGSNIEAKLWTFWPPAACTAKMRKSVWNV